MINVASRSGSYEVVCRWGALADLGATLTVLGLSGSAFVISDEHVAKLHGDAALASLRKSAFSAELHAIPAGEAHKNLDTVRSVYDWLVDQRAERGSPTIALGGGVTGDLTGFVAATYLRGVPFVQCPTSLLAMVDASIGGKVGVDHARGKNLIGAFYPPRVVISDPSLLKTLPPRALRDGVAEAIKHALIADPPMLDAIEDGAERLLAIDPDFTTEFVARSAPDGYTLLINTGAITINQSLYKNLPFSLTRDFAPVSVFSESPNVLVVPAKLPAKNVKELVAYAKANPGRLNYSSAGVGTTQNLAAELFKLKTGIPGTAIPYRSASEMVMSVVGGQSLYTFADSGITVPQAKAGKIRSLAVANPTRIAALPDVPTMPEAGLADVDIKPQWNGAFLKTGTPQAIVNKLEAALKKTLADPKVREQVLRVTYYPEGMGSAEFRARIDSDIKIFQEIVKAANLKFER